MSAPAPPMDKNGKVQLGRLRSATNQDGFDTPLCKPCLGPTCVGGGGCDVCCAAAFCPCFLLGSNVKMLHSGAYHSPCADVRACRRSEACMKFLVPYMCLFAAGWSVCPVGPLAFCPAAMYTASYRHKIRKEFGITSSGQCVPGFSNDIFVHFFCFPFALCQEHVELKAHLPFTPLKALYDDTGASLGVVSKKKKEAFKWSFNLDELSDDEDDEGEIAKRKMQRQATFTAPTSPAGMARSERSGAAVGSSAAGPKRLYKQDDSVYVDGRCNLCGAGPFHNLDQFSDHMVKHTNLRKIHEAIRNKTGTVTCNACGKPFNNVPALGAHRCKTAGPKR